MTTVGRCQPKIERKNQRHASVEGIVACAAAVCAGRIEIIHIQQNIVGRRTPTARREARCTCTKGSRGKEGRRQGARQEGRR